MKALKSLLLVILFSASSSNLLAQTDTTSVSKDQVQLHFLPGYALSYLKSLDSGNSVRYSLNLNLGLSGQESNNESKDYLQSPDKTDEETNSNFQSLSFSIEYVGYYFQKNNVKAYYGIGPILSLSRQSYFREIVYHPDGTQPRFATKLENNTITIGLGIVGSLGLEFKITNTLSLIGEYKLRGLYEWFSENQTGLDSGSYIYPESKIERTGNSWEINLNGFQLGIAVRF